jgi:hypothetical protein
MTIKRQMLMESQRVIRFVSEYGMHQLKLSFPHQSATLQDLRCILLTAFQYFGALTFPMTR